MINSYLKIAFRNIIRSKGCSLINVAGLAIGMASCLLIMLWVQDELSFDRFHVNTDNICRVVKGQSAVTPSPLAAALKDECPEIADATMFEGWREMQMSCGGEGFLQKCALAEPSFFDIFTFPFLVGDSSTALSEPFSVVLTKSVAEKFFGAEDPIGKTLNADSRFDLTVTGVIDDIPVNSHIRFDCVIPFGILAYWRNDFGKWRPNNYITYVKLHDDVSYKEVSRKISDFIPRHDPENSAIIRLQPLKDIHLYGFGRDGTITYVYVFSAMALLVLLIACMNFMNLATARSSSRATEISVRKAVGAQRADLIRQFFGESVLMSFFALILATALIELLLPAFRELSGKALTLDYFGNWLALPAMIGTALVTGVIAGSYPALFLSGFRPAMIQGSSLHHGSASPVLRRILVVTQFALSVFLIIGASVIRDQLGYLKEADLGYNSEHIVCLRLRPNLAGNLRTVGQELSQHSSVVGITLLSTLPDHVESTTDKVVWEGKAKDEDLSIAVISVDYGFLDVFGAEMANGRYFSPEFATDLKEGYIVNESAVKVMGIESPVGTRFSLFGREGTIVGVVKDFHHRSLHYEIEPLVLTILPSWLDNICIKISSDDVPATMSYLEKTFNECAPGYPFDYSFLDEEIDNLYRAEQRMGTIFDYSTLIAVFLSCLGLFGLASFTAEQRTKEIGIRKVLGASVPAVVALLSKEFISWVALANLIAWPVAYIVMTRWLEDFANRTQMEWSTFAYAALIAVAIAVLTVSSKAIGAALANPVDALKHE